MRRTHAVSIVAGVVALMQTGTPSVKPITTLDEVAYPAFAPVRDRIYFTDGDSVLRLFDRGTGRSTRVWAGELWGLAVSRAGDRITFVRSGERTGAYIWTLPLDPATGMPSATARRVSVSNGSLASISPDGRSLAYADGDTAPRIAVMPVEGGRERVLATVTGNITSIQWTPDGKTLYYGTGRSPRHLDVTRAIYRVSIDGGRPELVLQTDVSWNGPAFPGLSPDGQRLVTVRDGARRQVVIHDLTGKTLAEFTVPDGHGLEDTWTGATTLLTTRAATPSIVVAVSLQDGRRRALTDTAGTAIAPLFSPDGRSIAYYSVRDGHRELVIMNADGTGKRTVVLSPPLPATDVQAHGFQWSPDGQHILRRTSATEGGPLTGLGVIDATTGREQLIPNATLARTAHWTDARHLFYFQMIDSTATPRRYRQQLHLVDIESHGDELVGEVTANCPYCIDLANDSLIIFGRWDRVSSRLLRASGDGRRLAEGEPVESNNAFGSPDGRWAAWFVGSQRSGWVVELVRTDGTQRRRLLVPGRIVGGVRNPSFSADSRELTVMVLGEKEGDIDVLGADVASGDLRRLVTVERATLTMRDFSLSPDGRTLLYVRLGRSTTQLGELDIAPILRAAKGGR